MMNDNIYLKKNEVSGVIKDINLNEVDKVLGLQEKVFSYLKPNEKSYIVPKTQEQWSSFIEASQNKLIGIFLENKDELIAVTAVCCPTVSNDNTHLDAFHPKDLTRCAVMLGSKVAPQYRGNGLQKVMTTMREEWAQSLGRDTFLSEIEAHNYHSWVNLLKTGYSITGRAEIIEDNKIVPLYVAQKTLKTDEFSFQEQQISMGLDAFLDQEKALFNKGIGAISFVENIKSLNLGKVEKSAVYDITKIPKGATYSL